MLSSSMLKGEVHAILDLLAQSKTEEAKQRIQDLAPQVASENGKGALLALNGILNAMMKSKGNDQVLDKEKVQAAAERISRVQMIDELDRGYLQTLVRWAKEKPTQTTESESQA